TAGWRASSAQNWTEFPTPSTPHFHVAWATPIAIEGWKFCAGPSPELAVRPRTFFGEDRRMTRREAIALSKAACHELLDQVKDAMVKALDEGLVEARRKRCHLGSGREIRLDCVNEVVKRADELLERLPDVMEAALPDRIDDGDIEEL